MSCTYFIQYEVKPTAHHPEQSTVAGAYAHCWIVATHADQAEHVALQGLAEDGWCKVSLEEGPVPVTRQDYVDDLDLGVYFEAAQQDGACYLLHQWDHEGENDDDEAQRQATWMLQVAERPIRLC
jgi:hypothetical protein